MLVLYNGYYGKAYSIEGIKKSVEKISSCNFFWLINLVVDLVKCNGLRIDQRVATTC